MNQIWKSHSQNPCPSCAALDGQIHDENEWTRAGLSPRDHSLYCQEHCTCTLSETEESEIGDLAAVPLRREASMQTQIQLSLTHKGFEILAITAGKALGHPWTFPADTLRASVHLWNNIPVFIDHAQSGQSARNLAGTLTNITWDELSQGIKATLKPAGPAAAVLKELAEAALTDETLSNIVGFSADLFFTAKDKQAVKIERVNSVDAVVHPARGGKFIRALNSVHAKENHQMDNTQQAQANDADATRESAALQTLLDVKGKVTEIEQEQKKAKALRAQLCADVLVTALAASKLPKAMQDRIKEDFGGEIFEPSDLQKRIDADRALLSELSGSVTAQGPSRVSAMHNTDDQIRAAFQDMLGVERDDDVKNVKPARLQGIREAYLMMTGDYNLHGGYHSENVQLATTSDFTGLIKNALNKLVVKGSEQMGTAGYDWWKKIATVEHFNSLQSITGTLVGTVGSLPTVAEQAEYTEIAIGDSPETASWTKYGGYIPLTLELIDRDDTRRIKAYGLELGKAAMRNISEQIAAIFTQASGAGPTMADTGALFNSTAVTTAGGHANLLTTALGTDYTAWNAVAKAVYDQPMLVKNASGYYGTGKKLAIDPKYALVPRALKAQAEALFIPRWASSGYMGAAAGTGTMTYSGFVEVLTVPEWTDATDWAAACDPSIAPSIFLGERFGLLPEIFTANRETDPAVFMNDEHRIKVRHFLAVWVNDFRPLHKSNVA